MATLYRPGFSALPMEVTPKNGRDFGLKQLYELLECDTIEVVRLDQETLMIIDEEGKIRVPPKPANALATTLWRKALLHFHKSQPYDWIAGNALVCKNSELK